MRQIVANTGEEPSVVVNKVVEGKGNFGFNAQSGEYGDLVEMGVIDPTKVTRFALQNAASVAGLMLTTDAMVAELPKDEKGGVAAAWVVAWAAWAIWICDAATQPQRPGSSGPSLLNFALERLRCFAEESLGHTLIPPAVTPECRAVRGPGQPHATNTRVRPLVREKTISPETLTGLCCRRRGFDDMIAADNQFYAR